MPAARACCRWRPLARAGRRSGELSRSPAALAQHRLSGALLTDSAAGRGEAQPPRKRPAEPVTTRRAGPGSVTAGPTMPTVPSPPTAEPGHYARELLRGAGVSPVIAGRGMCALQGGAEPGSRLRAHTVGGGEGIMGVLSRSPPRISTREHGPAREKLT